MHGHGQSGFDATNAAARREEPVIFADESSTDEVSHIQID